MKVLIITPACNEEKNLPLLIKSMVNQSIIPFEWIIVDDGSKDNTSNVIQKAAIKFPWIKYLRKEKKSTRWLERTAPRGGAARRVDARGLARSACAIQSSEGDLTKRTPETSSVPRWL